ncbi:UNVERIFIED_CONTAM: hypothetical protein Sangu_2174200 [Sesamum angustifolium]|uniref:F-box domain-containing protein n=1 Tax=Sesamum angustifolium TaxID=2727405 RepID=A0AAW2LEM7_9LAMI
MVDESFSVSEFSSLADKVASIDYILTKIFECLPLRSLVRFEAVSKHWFSLITDPQFSPLLKPRYASGLFLLPSKLQDEPFSCEVDFLPLNVLGPVEGILTTSFAIQRPRKSLYYVGQLMVPTDHGEAYVVYIWHPLKAPDYKVICVWRFAGDLLYKILIYSSETLSESFYYSSKAHFDRGAYWNGAVHWHCDTDNWLYFNIDKEKLNIMPPPVKLEDGLLERPFVYFGESGGHLHVIEDYSQAAALYIYEMEIDYSGGTRSTRLGSMLFQLHCRRQHK